MTTLNPSPISFHSPSLYISKHLHATVPASLNGRAATWENRLFDLKIINRIESHSVTTGSMSVYTDARVDLSRRSCNNGRHSSLSAKARKIEVHLWPQGGGKGPVQADAPAHVVKGQREEVRLRFQSAREEKKIGYGYASQLRRL